MSIDAHSLSNVSPFSVLMPVYPLLDPAHLHAALESVAHQSLPPGEIVLVRDGLLGPELEEVIQRWSRSCPNLIGNVTLTRKAGSATAFQAGLLRCSHDLVARMDSDDVSVEGRFARQVAFMDSHRDVDVLGGWTAELDESMVRVMGVRQVPVGPERIAAMAPFRCPLNHSTVMYRKEAVLACGGYESRFGELADYHLWAKMLRNGSRMYNLPEILVMARASHSFFQRRGGWSYARTEMRLMKELLDMEVMDLSVFFWNTSLRLGVRALPTFLRRLFYNGFLRS